MENVHAVCKCYDVLDSILGSRPRIQPILMNNMIAVGQASSVDLDESSDDSELKIPDLQEEDKAVAKLRKATYAMFARGVFLYFLFFYSCVTC
jgi:hypothetical protein